MLQYFISTHGARKGLADTALKTADSGYLTRRLVDVAQDVIINEFDCGTADGIYVEPILEAGVEVEPLRDRVIGRVSLEKIKDYEGNVIVEINQEITEELANAIQAAGIERVNIRSVLTCESRRGVCARCYGRNLATGRFVEMGEAVGVIAAQSIGEPGTQLTMRTFHIGGTATRVTEQSKVEARNNGFVKFIDLKVVEGRGKTLIAMNRSGLIAVVDEKGREKERHHVVYGARLRVEDGQPVTLGQIMSNGIPTPSRSSRKRAARSSSRICSPASPSKSKWTKSPAFRSSSSRFRRVTKSTSPRSWSAIPLAAPRRST